MDESRTPPSGYLSHDFARFRKQRLETQRLQRARAEAKSDPEPPEVGDPPKPPKANEDGMFFGTSSFNRRELRASTLSNREDRDLDDAEREAMRRRPRESAREPRREKQDPHDDGKTPVRRPRRRRPPPPLPVDRRDRGPRTTPPHGVDLRRRRRPRRAS